MFEEKAVPATWTRNIMIFIKPIKNLTPYLEFFYLLWSWLLFCFKMLNHYTYDSTIISLVPELKL